MVDEGVTESKLKSIFKGYICIYNIITQLKLEEHKESQGTS